jgi:glucose-6-phosphate isomerase
MTDCPCAFGVSLPLGIPSRYDNHIARRLSSMAGQFLSEEAREALLGEEDKLVYEVYEVLRPETVGELIHGLSVVRPGKVGDEFYMTKGHYHSVLETAEVYYCLLGKGYMVMETPEGDWAVEPLVPGKVLHVPPRWAHRSVNTDLSERLVTVFVYPAHAGHEYGTVERCGFRKLVVSHSGQPRIIDNPRWLPPSRR